MDGPEHTFADYFKSHAGLITQAIVSLLVIIIGFLYEPKIGFTVTSIVLVIDALSFLITKFKADSDVRIDSLSRKVDLLGQTTDVYRAAESICDVDLVQKARSRIKECVDDLEQLAHGIERVTNETDYFSILTQEAYKCDEGGEIWDVVMPFHPRRVLYRRPLITYIEVLRELITTRRLNYNIIIMAREDQEEIAPDTLKHFQDAGVHVFRVKRTSLPAHFISNFSMYICSKTVCWNQRADDGHILDGQRSTNLTDFDRFMAKLVGIKHYAVPFDSEAKEKKG